MLHRFGISTGKAKIDHVWTIVGRGDGSFVWLQVQYWLSQKHIATLVS